jgi:hypothetical protein
MHQEWAKRPRLSHTNNYLHHIIERVIIDHKGQWTTRAGTYWSGLSLYLRPRNLEWKGNYYVEA